MVFYQLGGASHFACKISVKMLMYSTNIVLQIILYFQCKQDRYAHGVAGSFKQFLQWKLLTHLAAAASMLVVYLIITTTLLSSTTGRILWGFLFGNWRSYFGFC